MTASLFRHRFVQLGFIMLAVVLVYYPGLFGDYLFDDLSNIVDNEKLAIKSLQLDALKAAAFSGDAGPLKRPVSVLSFALNYYFTGFDPFYFKLTNLVIHTINTLLVFFITKNIFKALTQEKKLQAYAPFLVALLWGVHPLNLTSVLYVVQRMVSLASLFGLLAIYAYTTVRIKQSAIKLSSLVFWSLFIGLMLVASIYSKESGVLFIPLIVIIELLIFKGQNNQQDIRVFGFKLIHCLILACIIIGLFVVTKIPPYLAPERFLNRGFDVIERLLTESRALFYYLKLFFYPRLTELSLYHDDFIISSSLTKPITTLYAVTGLAAITVIALFLVRKAPLILFAWLWFLIGHALESTFISLELLHEHRNYFAVIGFAFLTPLIIYYSSSKLKPYVIGFICLYVVYLGFTTWQRATLWSNLVDHAAFEAAYHPSSDRSNYQLARVYMKLMTSTKSVNDFGHLAEQALANARNSYKPSFGGWFASIHLSYYQDETPDPALIEELIDRLKVEPLRNSTVSYLSAFVNCQIDQHCKLPHYKAVEIISAGLSNPTLRSRIAAEINKFLARYFSEVAHDYVKAEEFLMDAVNAYDDINGRILLTQLLTGLGRPEDAQKNLNRAIKMDTNKVWYDRIMREQQAIERVKRIQSEENAKSIDSSTR